MLVMSYYVHQDLAMRHASAAWECNASISSTLVMVWYLHKCVALQAWEHESLVMQFHQS
jgi:hypothetical protein